MVRLTNTHPKKKNFFRSFIPYCQHLGDSFKINGPQKEIPAH
jgi:hypothetical protein